MPYHDYDHHDGGHHIPRYSSTHQLEFQSTEHSHLLHGYASKRKCLKCILLTFILLLAIGLGMCIQGAVIYGGDYFNCKTCSNQLSAFISTIVTGCIYLVYLCIYYGLYNAVKKHQYRKIICYFWVFVIITVIDNGWKVWALVVYFTWWGLGIAVAILLIQVIFLATIHSFAHQIRLLEEVNMLHQCEW